MCRFEDLWQDEVDTIEKDWAGLRDRAGRPDLADAVQDLSMRCGRRWPLPGWRTRRSPSIWSAVDAAPHVASLANLLGCLLWRQGRGRSPAPVVGRVAADLFQKAIDADPNFLVARVNLAESLDAGGRRAEAIEVLRLALHTAQRQRTLDRASLEGMPLCQRFDGFHVDWERAAWKAAGSPDAEGRTKRDLLLGKVHMLLAFWTGDLTHHYEALVRTPHLVSGRVALGHALSRVERPQEAAEHLWQSLVDNPLDRDAARLHFEVLGSAKDPEGRRQHAEDRRLLAQAAPQILPMESWFAEPRPRGNELVSVIILAGDASRPIRRPCLESILRHTRAPFELLLVIRDTDEETSTWIKEFERRPGSTRVELVRSKDHRGYGTLANQSLSHARGRFIALVEDEATVTPGWLDCLIALAMHDWPSAGLVGPMMNDAPPPQAVRADFPERDGLDEFAAQRRRTWSGLMIQTNRLHPSCVLTRREVLDRLGPFDERFQGGWFSVADLCLRAGDMGLRLLVAQDVFVYRQESGGATRHHRRRVSSSPFNSSGDRNSRLPFRFSLSWMSSRPSTASPPRVRRLRPCLPSRKSRRNPAFRYA